jgi:AcrR family transcriptional regulator
MSVAEGTVSSYDRLLQSGKRLFAARGYSNASTSAIARDAGTSESQLVKHFGGKDGLLAAIFDLGWQEITRSLAVVADHASPVERIRVLIEQIFAAWERDPELRQLMLLEGRRIRREGNAIMLTQGYRDFVRQTEELLAAIRDEGRLHPDLSPSAVRAAIMGMCEGLARDRLLAERQGIAPGYSVADLHRVVDVFLQIFLTPEPRTGER